MHSDSHPMPVCSLPPLPAGCNFPSNIAHYLNSNHGLTQRKKASRFWYNFLSNNNRNSNGQRSAALVQLMFALRSVVQPVLKETSWTGRMINTGHVIIKQFTDVLFNTDTTNFNQPSPT